MKQKIRMILATLTIGLALSACGGAPQPDSRAEGSEQEISIREAVTRPTPHLAVEEIYDLLPDARPESITTQLFGQLFPDLRDKVEEYYGCVSDPNGGLADILILLPDPEEKDTVREALLVYQEKRIRQFETYDILDAYNIAKNAVVFDQGDYIVLSMLPDNDAAQDILDRHMPL